MAAAATAVRTSTRDRKAVEPLVISAEVESKHEIVVPQVRVLHCASHTVGTHHHTATWRL